MDGGKENDALLFQHGTLTDMTPRVQGVKSVLASASKSTTGQKRKPFGIVNVQSLSGNNGSKDKDQKSLKADSLMMSEVKKPSMPFNPFKKSSGAVSAGVMAKQPSGIVLETVQPSVMAVPIAMQEFEEIETMGRLASLEDDLYNMCPIADQPATYVHHLLNWFPCMWSDREKQSSIAERCSSLMSLPDFDWRHHENVLLKEEEEEFVLELTLPDLEAPSDSDCSLDESMLDD